jgi:hypothetical protein
MYLLSDCSMVRERRIAKLIALVATCPKRSTSKRLRLPRLACRYASTRFSNEQMRSHA